MKHRPIIQAWLFVAASLLSGGVNAQASFPAKPIRIVVPFGPGGAPDIFARVTADKLAAIVGQPVVVENRTGASGIIGTGLVVNAPADGYTLLVATPSTTILAASNRKLNFDPVKDLQSVSMGVYMTPVLVTGAQSRIKDVRTAIDLAKAEPGKLVIASGGVGNSQHLAAEMFKQMAGIDLLHVPYQSTPAIMPSLVSGEVDLTFADASSLPLVKTGKLRALAVGSSERSEALPGVPTMAQAGVPGFVYQSWYGLVVRSGTPEPIVRFLNKAVNQALRDTEVEAKLKAAGLEPVPGTPQAMQAFITEDTNRWATVIRTAGIKFD